MRQFTPPSPATLYHRRWHLVVGWEMRQFAPRPLATARGGDQAVAGGRGLLSFLSRKGL
ncbi:MAG: hypothetical protein NZU63_14845 [Gemmataceae bacterium]|nr:hypothetical protein [Gemmataceae bacterium]